LVIVFIVNYGDENFIYFSLSLSFSIGFDYWDVDFVPEGEGHAYVKHYVVGPSWIIEDFVCSPAVIPSKNCDTSIPFKFFVIFGVFRSFDSIFVINAKI
jgi:hypothetical protein